MSEGIKDKVVVITGASSGLGEATAWALSTQGAHVVLGGGDRIASRRATELLDSVTDPDAAARARKFYAESAIPAASFARLVAIAINQPDDVDINEIVFRPTRQEY